MAKLTPKQREERIALVEEHDRKRRERFNDPHRVKRREWIKQMFKGDIDLIADMLVSAWEQSNAVLKENEELVEKLNRIHFHAYGLSSKDVAPHVKFNIARSDADWDPEDPVARVFMAALETGKSLTAMRNARKGHAAGNTAKAFVQDEWKLHRSAYAGNKSAFARVYTRRVFNEFDVKITEKQMREVWLKDEPLVPTKHER